MSHPERLIFALALSWLIVSPARATPETAAACTGPELVVESQLDEAFASQIGELEQRLRSLADVDPCASIHLSAAGTAVAIEVRLSDGRSTVRKVEEPQHLVPAAESLLMPLPVASSLSAESNQTASSSELTPPRRSLPQRRHALEAGLAASTRLAHAPSYIGYGLSADLSVLLDAWLFGSWLRWDFQDRPVKQPNIPDDLAMASFLLGIYGGRRVRLGRAALDLSLGPNLVIENQEAFEDTPNDVGGEILNVTLTTAARIVFPALSSPRGYLLLAEECYPRRVGHEVHEAATLPPLPAWSTTLALGISWRAL